jgi:hypothetical protein
VIRLALALIVSALVLTGTRVSWSAALQSDTKAVSDAPSDIVLTPFVGEYYWLVEAYLRIKGDFGSYLGPIAEPDIFGGFADADGDGREDFLVVVDNELTCDENVCDFFVFAPVVKDRSVDKPCDWQLVDDRPKPITRGLYERFVTAGDQSVALTTLPSEMPCTLNGEEWRDYFHFVYDTEYYTISEMDHHFALTDIRLGTYDVNDDGQDEIFIYIVPEHCPRCARWGHVIEIILGADGSVSDWRIRGGFGGLEPVLTSIDAGPTFLAPSAKLRVTGEIIDGHRSLCTSHSIVRWDGKAYVSHIYTYIETLRDEARALGCPEADSPRRGNASDGGEMTE